MIEISHLSKRYGERLAVDDLDVVVRAGAVTGFLGPNGAGKSTTMRMILGLDRPTSGHVRVNGHRYVDTPAPLTEVGALLEARALHPGRSARDHLLALAATTGIGARRVDEMLALVGLQDVARQRAGRFSLGMGQRLGIAGALLGDPRTVILDEPVNGLDPEGVHWIRSLLRGLAAEGRTVLVSSHLMSEMAMTADHLVVLGRGRLIADESVESFVRRATGGPRALVRTPDPDGVRRAVAGDGVEVVTTGERLEVLGLPVEEIGERVAAAGVVLHELTPVEMSLEEAYMAMTQDAVEFGVAA